jgi:hypothetical protein
VRKSGSKLRITARLVSAEDGYQLWSEAFERRSTDVFAVQEEIAAAIVGKVRGRLRVPTNLAGGPRTPILPYEPDVYLRGQLASHER